MPIILSLVAGSLVGEYVKPVKRLTKLVNKATTSRKAEAKVDETVTAAA